MGMPLETEEAALVIGVLCGDRDLLESCPVELAAFGEIVDQSPAWNFDFTRYYEKSMGSQLFRQFFLFAPGYRCENLAQTKLSTNALETEIAKRSPWPVERPINLDPGYLTLSKLVLASTKNHSHRIYLRDRIYAEITLYYQKKTYRPWPWTFPDYASELYVEFFNNAREEIFGP